MKGLGSVAMRILLTSALLLAACTGTVSNTTPPDAQTTFPDGDGGTGSGCEVLTLLQARCTSCHADVPLEGAPMPLTTLADLRATSQRSASESNAQRSIARMRDDALPMPPAPHDRA